MILYRIEYVPSSDWSDDDIWSVSYELKLFKLEVLRETTCGYWIKPYNSVFSKDK